jgi:hypothetical protein
MHAPSPDATMVPSPTGPPAPLTSAWQVDGSLQASWTHFVLIAHMARGRQPIAPLSASLVALQQSEASVMHAAARQRWQAAGIRTSFAVQAAGMPVASLVAASWGSPASIELPFVEDELQAMLPTAKTHIQRTRNVRIFTLDRKLALECARVTIVFNDRPRTDNRRQSAFVSKWTLGGECQPRAREASMAPIANRRNRAASASLLTRVG